MGNTGSMEEETVRHRATMDYQTKAAELSRDIKIAETASATSINFSTMDADVKKAHYDMEVKLAEAKSAYDQHLATMKKETHAKERDTEVELQKIEADVLKTILATKQHIFDKLLEVGETKEAMSFAKRTAHSLEIKQNVDHQLRIMAAKQYVFDKLLEVGKTSEAMEWNAIDVFQGKVNSLAITN